MKSKKFVAVALSAAIAFSAAYVSRAAIAPNTLSVSAAKASVKTTVPYDERKTETLYVYNSNTKGKELDNAFWDWKNGGDKYGLSKADGEPGYLTFKALKDLVNLPDYPDQSISKFKGWGYGSNEGTALEDKDPVRKENGSYVYFREYLNDDGTKKKDSESKIMLENLYAIYERFATDEEAEANAAAIAAAEEEKKEEDERTASLDRRLWRNYAGNNVKTWWNDPKKDADGNTVKDENGNVVYERKEGYKTAWPRAILVTGTNGKFTTERYNKNKDPKEDWMTELMYEGALKSAKVVKPEATAYFVYDVHWNAEDNVIGLLDGKYAQVKLSVTDYDLGAYQPYLYRIVYTSSGYKRQQVEGLDVGKKDITFYTNQLCPHVLVLVPKERLSTGSEYDNPPTGDASALPVALFAAASLSGAGALVMRRKRELGE